MNRVLLAGLYPMRLALYELTRTVDSRAPARITFVKACCASAASPRAKERCPSSSGRSRNLGAGRGHEKGRLVDAASSPGGLS